MRRLAYILALFLSLGSSGLCVDPAPLPPELLAAKKVCLVNDTNDEPKVFDHLYDRLKKWGRWKLTQREQDADVLVVFSEKDTYMGATGSIVSGTGVITPIISMQRFLVAVDRPTGRKLLAVSCERRLGSGYTAGVLVNRLRKRIEQADRKAGNKD